MPCMTGWLRIIMTRHLQQSGWKCQHWRTSRSGYTALERQCHEQQSSIPLKSGIFNALDDSEDDCLWSVGSDKKYSLELGHRPVKQAIYLHVSNRMSFSRYVMPRLFHQCGRICVKWHPLSLGMHPYFNKHTFPVTSLYHRPPVMKSCSYIHKSAAETNKPGSQTKQLHFHSEKSEGRGDTRKCNTHVKPSTSSFRSQLSSRICMHVSLSVGHSFRQQFQNLTATDSNMVGRPRQKIPKKGLVSNECT